jgi:hypothetical protein
VQNYHFELMNYIYIFFIFLGHCYACQNQGMHALQHPILGLGYEGGHAAMGPPFVYLEDDDYFD